MKKYLLLIDILPFWSGMSRGKMKKTVNNIVPSFQAQKARSIGLLFSCSKRQVRYQAALSLYFNVCGYLRCFCHGIDVLNLCP